MTGVEGFALSRIAVGAGVAVAPKAVLGRLLGRDSASPGAQLLARAAGGRDVALGLGLLLAARHDAPVRGWLEAGTLADATDAVASLLAARQLPHRGGFVMAAAAIGGVVAGRWLVSSLPEGSAHTRLR